MEGVDILIVGYRSEDYLPRLLEDIRILSCLPHEVHYWDNLGNPKSLSIAWNDLAAQGRRDYICVMNPDVALSPMWDAKLVRALENPAIGTAHPEDYGPNGAPCPSREALAAAASKAIEDIRVETWDVTHCGIHALRFHCPMIRRADWNALCGVDERMRQWKSDSDFHWRMRSRLGKVASYVKGCVIWHRGYASCDAAQARGEIDMAAEERLSNEMWARIRGGQLTDWDLLLPTGRLEVRKDQRFRRGAVYGPGLKTHRARSGRARPSGAHNSPQA